MIRMVVNGVCGKMGRALCESVMGSDITVVAGVDKFAAGTLYSFPMYEELALVKEEADVIVDFSRADALDDVLTFALARKIPCVLPTTGYTPEDIAKIEKAALTLPVFRSANMSFGLNLLGDMARRAAPLLSRFDCEIVETHHNSKVDAPSGSALMLAETIKNALNGKRTFIFGRHGKNERRKSNEIGIHSLRGGTVVGRHEINFFGGEEAIILTHDAASRRVFALGAVQAVRFILGKHPRVYDMMDLINDASTVTSLKMDDTQALLHVKSQLNSIQALSRIFSPLAEKDILVDMISHAQTENGVFVDFSLGKKDAVKAKTALYEAGFTDVTLEENIVKINIEGVGMEKESGVAAQVFTQLDQAGVEVKLVTTSETQIQICTTQEKATLAQNVLLDYFKINEN